MQVHHQRVQHSNDWQQQLRDTVGSAAELLGLLDLKPNDVDASLEACQDFPLKVPHSFVQRMMPGDPLDPLLLQVLATGQEMLPFPGYTHDPVGENGPTNPQPGIIHKYHGRVLLIVSSGCAINCRYCFRRHFPYSENQNSRDEWRKALQYIRADDSIEEVILSGGDPLVATDEHLQELIARIAAIPHVRRLRIHSRLPIVIPERVTANLLAAITHAGLQTLMVVHCNHAQEINRTVKTAITALRDHGIVTLNQAVLLRGVNDTVAAQVELSQKLFAAGALPYYLHLLDKVQGAAHFEVPELEARQLMAAVAARLSGYMVPKLVRETAGADAKIVVVASQQ